jgi:Domain of unknown function (DUF4328)
MLSIAGCAIAYLLDALSPLLEAWALSRGPQAAQRASGVSEAITGVLAVTVILAAMAFLVWAGKARANLAVLYDGPADRSARRWSSDRFAVAAWFIPVTNLILPPLQIAELAVRSVGRSRPRGARRRIAALVWTWWTVLMAAGSALVVAVAVGLDNDRELGGIRADLLSGLPVDGALARDLLGRQVALRLPSAALLVLAAVLAVLVVGRITGAQYAKVARLRLAPCVPDEKAMAGDLTVILPAAALVDLLSDDEGERTTVLPVVALGGTIGA